MKCVYCHNEGNKKISKLSVNDIRYIVENSKGLKLTNMRLTGGEPLIHPDIYKICKMLSEEYNLKVGINTNCIEIDKIIYMIKKGWIDRVIVGLDYFDGVVSKQSPIGKTSKEILSNILKIKKLGCNVSISTVYNNNYDNIFKLVDWCVNNKIRIKIIELIKNEIHENSDLNYIKMRDSIIKDYKFKVKIDELEEYNCYIDNFNVVSFFPSLCRLRRCDICKKIHLRITSEGNIKQCIHYENNDKSVIGKNSRANILEEINRDVDYHYEVKNEV